MMRYSHSPDFKDWRFFKIALSRVLVGLRPPPPLFPLIFKNGAMCLCEKAVVVLKKTINFPAHFSFTETKAYLLQSIHLNRDAM